MNTRCSFATESDSQERNGPVALEYALKAADMTYLEDPWVLSTLAADYAEPFEYLTEILKSF